MWEKIPKRIPIVLINSNHRRLAHNLIVTYFIHQYMRVQAHTHTHPPTHIHARIYATCNTQMPRMGSIVWCSHSLSLWRHTANCNGKQLYMHDKYGVRFSSIAYIEFR